MLPAIVITAELSPHEAAAAAVQAAQSLGDTLNTIVFWGVVILIAAVLIFGFEAVRRWLVAQWGKVFAEWQQAKDLLYWLARPKPDAQPGEPMPHPPNKPAPAAFGIAPDALLRTMATDSNAVEVELKTTYADGKTFQVNYSIKEVPAK